MKKKIYTETEMKAIVATLLRMDGACDVCIDMDEVQTLIWLKRIDDVSLTLKMLDHINEPYAEYVVNSSTLEECWVHGNRVYLNLACDGDTIVFKLAFFANPLVPEGLPECCYSDRKE